MRKDVLGKRKAVLAFLALLFFLPGCGAKVIKMSAGEKIPIGFISSDVVLYYNGFGQAPIDYYEEGQLFKDWADSLYIENGVIEGRTTIVRDENRNRGHVLKVLYPKGIFGPKNGGAQWLMKLGGKYEELCCSYWVKFPSGFEFVKGGKLPGLVGGEANTGGKKPSGKDGWSVRIMWQKNGYIRQYVYHVSQKDSLYGDGRPWQHLSGKNCLFVPGEWYHLETYVKMNSPGKNDGIITCWLNGELVMEEGDFRFRDIGTLEIDAFYFSTFFGGGDESWAAARREYVYFDDFIISFKPVHKLMFKK